MASELPADAADPPVVPDIDQALTDLGVPFQAVELAEEAPTTAEAAAALGCPASHVGKTIAFVVAGSKPGLRVAVVCRGDRRLNVAAVAQRVGVSRRSLKGATPEQCLEGFGAAPGGVGPLAHPAGEVPSMVLVDAGLLEPDVEHVFVSGGSARRCVRLTVPDLLRAVPRAGVLGLAAAVSRTLAEYACPAADSRPLTVVEDAAGLQALARALAEAPRFGVDTEHSPLDGGFLCLVQISTDAEDFVVDPLVVEGVADVLRGPLADPGKLKVLHSCSSDLAWLWRYWRLSARSVYDTGGAAVELHGGANGHSLAAVVARHCPGVALDKALQKADWAQRPLPAAMLAYARLDSMYLLRVADCQLAAGVSEAKVMARGDHFLATAASRAEAMDYTREPSAAKPPKAPADEPRAVQRMRQTGERPSFLPNGDVYGNVSMLNPAGELMCRMSARKKQWYLDRGLAVELADGGGIQLLFEPKGRGYIGDEFQLADRENRCVVCAAEEMLSRHHIVPHAYKRFFDGRFRDHWQHDIVLVCYACKLRALPVYDAQRAAFGEDVGVPVARTADDEGLLRARRARKLAGALIKSGARMPPERLREVREEVAEFLGVPGGEPALGDEQVRALAEHADPAAFVESHSRAVARAWIGRELLFIKHWRRVFIDQLQPQHMPPGWDMDRDDSGHT